MSDPRFRLKRVPATGRATPSLIDLMFVLLAPGRRGSSHAVSRRYDAPAGPRGSRQFRTFLGQDHFMGHTWPEKLAEATRLLARVDPIGLIADGCPDDEYEAEAEELLKSRKPLTSEAVQKRFLRWFGAQISEHKAKQVAEGVTEIRQR